MMSMSDKVAVLRSSLKNRVVGHGVERVDQLLANPGNWRIHPANQQDALAGAIDEIGFIRSITVNQVTGRVVDGHLRVTLAARSGVEELPVEYVELSEAEEAKALLALDPIAAMAEADSQKLDELLRQVHAEDERLQDMLAEIAGSNLSPHGDDLQEGVEGGAPIYSDDIIVDAAFLYFREYGFPYCRSPIHVSMQEINKLAGLDADSLVHSSVANRVASSYHPERYHANAAGMRSQFEAYCDDKLLRHALELDLKWGVIGVDVVNHLKFVHGTQSLSNFRPGFACYIYRKYAAPGSVVLDTSAGYGGRLVGAIASGVVAFYIGIDPNRQTCEGNIRMAHDLGFFEKIEFHSLPAEDVAPELLQGRCDLAFTSPPYFAKEHYSDDESQSWVRYKTGDEWRLGFLRNMLVLQFAALKPGCYAIVNIADVKINNRTYPLYNWTIEDGRAAGFEYIETLEFPLSRRFGAGMAEEVAIEPVIVFRKPL